METSEDTEQAIVRAACAGDRAAFGTLVRLYQRRAYAAAYALTGNREDALELAQEGFVRAWRAMSRFDPAMPFHPWLYRIIRNLSLNHLKKRRRRGEQSLTAMVENGYDVRDAGPGPRGAAEHGDLVSDIQQAMASLTEDQQEILRMRHFLEMSYLEIAQALAIPQGTVMSRLHAARKNLRRAMEEVQAEEEAVNV
jgi:RNA polymerase sigma-70 factor (ECF subfamily)